ncbi:MAG TPA: hypothetical protein VHZ24_20830 [Pirellulales bacterium]|nr:hypothetical protein [Pirellulales bacterium]
MASLSIVIPAQDQIASLETTLASALAHAPAGSEVVVVLTTAYDDPYHLDGEISFVRLEPGASRVECLNAGIAASHGEVIHLLAVGATVDDGWTGAAVGQFRDGSIALVAPSINATCVASPLEGAQLRFDVAENRKNPYALADAVSLDALFVRRAALPQAAEPLCADLGDRLAGVDLARWLQNVGHRLVSEPRTAIQAPVEHQHDDDSAFAAGRQLERLFWRNLPQTGALAALAAHARTVLTECVASLRRPRIIARFLGRVAGLCEYPSYLRHWHERSRDGRRSITLDDKIAQSASGSAARPIHAANDLRSVA